MNDIVTVSESFVKFLEDQNIATFNTDLFLGQVPQNAPDQTYWVITSGGSPIMKLRTGEKVKQYFISVYYRSAKEKNIERNLFNLEELLNSPECFNLEGFELINVEATQFPSDEDIDNENRRIGFIQVSIQTYKNKGN